MRICCVFMLMSLIILPVRSNVHSQRPLETGTVHVRAVDWTGHDLGEAKIAAFRSTTLGKDLANRFQKNAARDVPFGIYRLRVYATGFWSAEREVRVFQQDVWVVVALELGMGKWEGGLSTSALSGSLKNLKTPEPPVWIRLSGVYSGVIIDTKASATGDFRMAGIPQGYYVLITTRNERIEDVRKVEVPALNPIEIELSAED